MDLIIEFVTENYVWVIVAGIVILMAVVGYIADKTDFGRNKFESEPEEEKEKVKPEKIVKEKVKKEKVKKEKNKKEKVVEELPIVEPITLESVNNETFEQPIYNETQKDFQIENNTYVDDNGQFTTDSLNQEIETEQTVDQSLFEPLPSIDQVFSDQPVEGNNIDVTSEPINVNLTNEEVQNSEVESDDDIWKF